MVQYERGSTGMVRGSWSASGGGLTMYEYATYRTLFEALNALEDMYATGEVVEGEIVHRDPQRPSNHGRAYAIMTKQEKAVLIIQEYEFYKNHPAFMQGMEDYR